MEWITIVGSKQANAYRGSIDGISPALTSAMGMGGGMTPLLTDATIQETLTHNFMEQERKQKIELPPELQGKKFRIRKLTPREVLRLMDCEEDDIDKMLNCGLSNSSIYKLAGNSIVQSVLYWIFYKMFINTEDENNGQLTLF